MNFRLLICIFVFSLLLFSGSSVNADKTVIKIALVTPEGSTWTNTLRRMVDEVRAKTGGEIDLKVYSGGISGDELDVIRKIQAGRIHAAGFSGVGLGVLLPKIRILEAPLLYKSYEEIDLVKERLYKEFAYDFEKQGYILLGFAEAGFVYFFSSHEISKQDDLQRIKMWVWKGDPVAQTFFSTFGIKTFPLHLADVNTGLETGMIDSFYSPTLAAVAFQWYTKIKNMLDYPMVNSTGALLMSKKTFEQLSEKNQSILKEAAKKYCAELVRLTRRDNDEAREILKESGVKFVLPSKKEVYSFEENAKKTYEINIPELYSKDLFNRVQEILTGYRETRKIAK
ncbi:MAG: TRAP transporter substrate-binding protein DctP [Desulfobacterales bacterium]